MGVGLGLLGAAVLLVKSPFIMGILGLAFVSYAAFFIGWSAMGLFPNFIFLVILMSISVKALLGITRLSNRAGALKDARPVWLVLRTVLFIGLVIQAGILLIRNFENNNLGDFYTSRDLGAFMLNQMPIDARIIPRYSIPQFNFFYLQRVEGYRRDIGVFNYDIFQDDRSMRSFIVKELKLDFQGFFWDRQSEKRKHFCRKTLFPYGEVLRVLQGGSSGTLKQGNS